MSDARSGRITILMDPADDVAVTRALLQRHDPAAGQVVVHPTPGARGPAALAHDVLGALGRPVHLLGEEKLVAPGPAWRAVIGWVTAEHLEQLTVLRAHRLSGDSLTRLVELAHRSKLVL